MHFTIDFNSSQKSRDYTIIVAITQYKLFVSTKLLNLFVKFTTNTKIFEYPKDFSLDNEYKK